MTRENNYLNQALEAVRTAYVMLDASELESLAARQALADMRATIRAMDPDMFQYPGTDDVPFPFVDEGRP